MNNTLLNEIVRFLGIILLAFVVLLLPIFVLPAMAGDWVTKAGERMAERNALIEGK